jgi:hypothetical protein
MRATQTSVESKGVPTASAPPLSSVGTFRSYYDTTLQAIMLSVEGNAYAAIPTSFTSSWARDLIAGQQTIHQNDPTDVVAVSPAALPVVPAGSSMLVEMNGQTDGAGAIVAGFQRTAGMIAGERIAAFKAVLQDDAADAGGPVTVGALFQAHAQLGVGVLAAMQIEGNADGMGNYVDFAIRGINNSVQIQTVNNVAGLPAASIALYTETALAGEQSGGVLIKSGNSDFKASNITLTPGYVTGGAPTDHASVVAQAGHVDQVPFYVKAKAAQVGDLTEWRSSTALVMAAVSAGGSFVNNPIVAAAGGDSSRLTQQGQTSVGVKAFDQYVDGDAASDKATRYVLDPAGAPFEAMVWDNTAGTRSWALFGGAGAIQTGRPGQITDNSTGTSSGAVPAVVGSGDDITINNIHASLLARINAMEQMLKDAGFFS